MNSYQEAKALLDRRANQGHPRAKLHKNVYLEPRSDGKIAVKYHDTDIIVYHPDGKIELDNGGWQTSSTKNHLCTNSPFHVYQEKGIWYVNMGPDFRDEDIIEFKRGMILDTPKWVIDTRAA
jgi:hypothetical protein